MSHAERPSDRELEQIFPGESALAGLMCALEACIP
jgi:hypothetical protein